MYEQKMTDFEIDFVQCFDSNEVRFEMDGREVSILFGKCGGKR